MRTASAVSGLLLTAALLAGAAPASAAPQPWTNSSVPLPDGATGGELSGVTAAAADDVWAVGAWTDTASHPLAVHWNGSGWTDAPVDDSAAPGRYRITAVDAAAAGDVWAVGTITSDAAGRPDTALVLHYTGGAWHVQRPTASPLAGDLTGIDMVSGTDGWAVGQVRQGDSTSRPMILQYRAGAWSQVLLTVSGNARLTSVYGTPSGEAWAVGSQQLANGGQTALILHWDGTSWQTVAAPAIPGDDVSLNRVAGLSATDVWAAGSVCHAASTACTALALHLSGGQWQAVPTAGGAELTGIAPQSATNVWLAGYAAFDPTTDTDHVEQWNGKALAADNSVQAVVPVINNLGQLGSALADATPDRAGGMWAVGWTRQNGSAPMPSALHRT